MRHGQTNYNRLGLCNNDPAKDVHLTPDGITQAEIAAQQLRRVPLEFIIVSELPRTRETAEIINRYHHVPIQTEPAINDIRSGFDSLPVTNYFQAIKADPLHITPPGGESLLTHKKRIFQFLDYLILGQNKHVLVIAHEETLRTVSCYFHNLTDEQMLTLHFQNCAILEFSPQSPGTEYH